MVYLKTCLRALVTVYYNAITDVGLSSYVCIDLVEKFH